ncbi:hypothetical protein [Haloarcula halophila]|uniref:hypothetical protein n=1 Tax=Haloarcula TaxID=2237 RepID=UPI0023E40B6F|nr:hypothetical protein [Halomicroarcula sp. DFY41]
MTWLSENRHWLLFAGVVLTTLGTVGVAVAGVVTTLTTLVSGGPLLPTLPAFILGTFLLAGLDIVLVVALVAELASRASLPKSQRVADGLSRLERLLPPLSALGLADRFEPPEPTVEERREELTRQYVEGELSEAQLEARLRSLLDEETADRDAPSARAVVDERAVAEADGDGGTDETVTGLEAGERGRETER